MRVTTGTVLFVCVLSHSARAQESTPERIAAKIDAYAAPFVEAGHLSGTFLVARGNEILYEKSWGLANRESNVKFQNDTPCCIASVTKPTTVILAATLVEQGAISLRDPVSNWLEDFPMSDQLQVQHLLFHRSGIPHRLTEPDREDIPRTAADMVELARNCEFDFEPGTRRQYSSGGYSVLVRVLELASGKTYAQLLHETILDPVKTEHTVHPGPAADLSNAAASYSWTVDGQRPTPARDYSFLVGAGSLFSTPRDMFLIARGVIDGEFPERAKKQLLRGGRLRWNGIASHYRAYLDYDTKSDLMVVMVSNQLVGANDLLRINVPRIVAGEAVELPKVPEPEYHELSQELLERYQGQYNIAGSPMPVRAKNGALFANDWLLLPVSETTFFSPQDYGTITIVGTGEIPEALDWSGMECPRIGPLD